MFPLRRISKRFGDVSDHVDGLAADQLDIWALNTFTEPRHADPMGAPEMPHSRIAAGLTQTYHRLVILEAQGHGLVIDGSEEIQHWHSLCAQTERGCHDLCLRGTVADRSLFLRDSQIWELCFAPGQVKMDT